MIFKTEGNANYDVHVRVLGPNAVNLSLQLSNEYASTLTSETAKRVAYALLLAADGIDPKPKK